MPRTIHGLQSVIISIWKSKKKHVILIFVVVGEKEFVDKTVSVRNRKDRTKEYALDEFIGIMENEIREKKIDQDF